MARAGHDDEQFFSAYLTPSDCYVMMSPIAGASEQAEQHKPTKNEEFRPTPAERRHPVGNTKCRLSKRRSRVFSPTNEPVSVRIESTYDSLDIQQEPQPEPRPEPRPEPKPQPKPPQQSEYDSPMRLNMLKVPESRRAVESQYENVVLRQRRLPRVNHVVQPVQPQPALPIRSKVRESKLPMSPPEKRFSRQVGKDIQQQLENVVSRRPNPFPKNSPEFPSPKTVVPQPIQKVDSDPVFPGFKKTGLIDFDARIYRCNELSRSNIAKQTLVVGEQNFACAYVNHLGGYLKLMRPQATLFIPPHAILGDPEPVVLYFMSKTNQIGYQPLISCLQPDQFLVSPIMYVGKPGFKYSTVDVVLSFPLEDTQNTASFFSVLTVKTFDTACYQPENAKWRILAPGHDYFFTVCGGRGILMVSQSAFYVIRATKAAPEYQNLAIPRDTSTRKIRVALFGRSFPESNRAKLHVVFCKDCDKEVERVIESEKRESFRKLDHVRALSIQTSSGQPIWVTFCQMKNTSWCLQTSPTAKFTPDELFNYADQYSPSVTFALSNPTSNLVPTAEAFVQCMVVVHEGSTADHQAEDVTSFIHLVGDVTVAKSGQFQSQSLGRASGKRLPVLPVPPSTGGPHGEPSRAASSHRSLSPQSSMTPSDCPSSSPPPVPSDRASVLLMNSYDSQSDTAKARFEEIYVSYQTLAELCLMLQASKAEGKARDWMTFANKIGLSTQQVDRMSDRYNFQSPMSIIHLFFGTCQSATSCCPSTTPREKARGTLARLLSVFQEMKRDDLIRVVRRELTRIDQEIDRYSLFLFEGGEFEIRTNVGGAAAANRRHPRHSFSDGDVTVLTPSAETIKGRLNDIVNWFRSKTKSSESVPKQLSGTKATAVEDIYEVPKSNFSVFEDQSAYEPLVAVKGRKDSNSEKKKDKAKQNDYY